MAEIYKFVYVVIFFVSLFLVVVDGIKRNEDGHRDSKLILIFSFLYLIHNHSTIFNYMYLFYFTLQDNVLMTTSVIDYFHVLVKLHLSALMVGANA